MKRDRLIELLSRFKDERIAVMGDLFLDRWFTIDNSLDEASLETGLTAWQAVKSVCQAGAAGTVLNTLSELGVGKLYAVSMLGKDGEGFEVKRALTRRGVDLSYVIESEDIYTPAYMKPMFIEKDAPLREGNRLDVRNRSTTPQHIENRLLEALRDVSGKVDAIILLDQICEENTGVITSRVRDEAARLGRENPRLIIFADSRAFINRFRDIIIKCNNLEAAAFTGLAGGEPFVKEQVFASLDALSGLTNRRAFVTCNVHGIAVNDRGDMRIVPAVTQKGPIDICGAGDACSAGIVTALCAGATVTEAAAMGNLCAGVTVRKLGCTGTASQDEVAAIFDEQFGGAGDE